MGDHAEGEIVPPMANPAQEGPEQKVIDKIPRIDVGDGEEERGEQKTLGNTERRDHHSLQEAAEEKLLADRRHYRQDQELQNTVPPALAAHQLLIKSLDAGRQRPNLDLELD